jgi:hypothetical protein
MVDLEFVKSLKDGVLQAGAPGSTAYQAALNQLIATQAGLLAKIGAGDGKQVVSVTSGESAAWSAPMTLHDSYGCYTRAINELMGLFPIVRRTSARFWT